MKKLFTGLLACATVLGLASCGTTETTTSAATTTQNPTTVAPTTVVDPNPDTSKVIADTTVFGYSVTGNGGVMKVGDKEITGWGFPSDDKTVGWMTATSLDAVAKVNKNIAAQLKAKKLKGLYLLPNIEIGSVKLTGTKAVAGEPGATFEVDKAYEFKIIQVIEKQGKKVAKSWLMSPESGKCESLTPNNLWVNKNYSDKKDKYQRDWNSNPLVVGGAGTYTAILARYGEAGKDAPVFGMGLVKLDTKEEAFVPTLHHYQLIGQIGGENLWSENNNSRADLVFDKNNELTHEFKAGDAFKVIKYMNQKDGSVTGVWSNGALSHDDMVTEFENFETNNDKNIIVKKACKLKLKVTDAGKLEITEVKATPAA